MKVSVMISLTSTLSALGWQKVELVDMDQEIRIRTLVQVLKERHPSFDPMSDRVFILVNGVLLQGKHFAEHILNDGDSVKFVYVAYGG